MGRTAAMFSVVIPILAVILFGMMAHKRNWLSEKGVADFKTLITRFCLPALVFGALYHTTITVREFYLVAVIAAFMIIAFIIGKIVNRFLKIPQDTMPFICTTIEGGQLGYALFILMFGQENLSYMAFVDLGCAIVMFPVLLTILGMRDEGRVNPKTIAKNVINPINCAIASSLIISISGAGAVIAGSSVGPVLNSVMDYIGKPVSVLILVCIGFGLNFRKICWSDAIKTIVTRLIIFAVFGSVIYTLVVKVIFPDNILYHYATLLGLFLPPTFMLSAYARGESEEAFVGSILAVYTIFSLIAFFILTWFALGV